MQKHMLETGAFITETIALEVPHRHIVFTIPKLMRKNFYWHRPALNDLSRMAWDCIHAFMCNTLQRDGSRKSTSMSRARSRVPAYGRPGGVISIETAGEYQDPNPHIHLITTDGIFTPSGSFYFMPRYGDLAEKYLRSLWEVAITNYVLEKGFVTEETIAKVSGYRHNGFSVYARRRVEFKKSDERSVAEFEQLARYIVKPHFSLESMEYVPQTGKVLYHGTMNKGKRRNFEIFEANDFLAAVTSHIPKYRQRYINYYGEYSSRARAKEKEYDEMPREGATVEQREYRKRWAMLIRKVYEVDPLKCPKCGKEMQIVEYIREGYTFLYKQWLVSIDAWHLEPPRAPPVKQEELPLTYCPISEDAHYVDEFADA